jgi:uroporphyrinogen-III synthase
VRDQFNLVVLLTGVGTRALLDSRRSSARSIAIRRGIAANTHRGARTEPVAVLRELGVSPWVVAPEPNTWQELLGAIDAKTNELSLQGARVAIQEYGTRQCAPG